MLCAILVSCNKTYDYIATDYYKVDLTHFKGKSFKEIEDGGFADLCQFDNTFILKSDCGSIVAVSCSTVGSLFYPVSDSLYFPMLFNKDIGFLYEFSSYIRPMRSGYIDKDLKSLFFINEHWNYPEYSGILMVIFNDFGSSYFMILEKSDNSDIEENWENAKTILNPVSILK